ncbi:MFS transporter [Streptomyces sp. NPDC004610]|uniref:MFS transporter n=1 Tax=unclassified Streptomyces TaxID=2593676 RepID=UPI0033A35E7E
MRALTGAVAPDRRRPDAARVFPLLGSLQVTLIFTLASLAVPLPEIGRRFALGRDELILLSAAYGLAFAGLLLFGGRLADRYGGRSALIGGLWLFAVASVAAPLAPGYEALLAARFAQGAGAALIAPAAMTVLRALYPRPGDYRRAMATWGGLSVLGATAGQVLSGVVSALSSWRWALVVPAVVAVAGLVLVPRTLPPGDRPPRSGGLDVRGAVLATGGLVAASYGLVVTDARPWGSALVLGPLAVGVALLALFAVAERRARDPLLPPGFLRDGRRGLGLLATALTAAGTSTVFILFSLFLQEERDWSALRTSAAFVPFAVALLVSGRMAGRLIARYGPGPVTGGGLALAAGGLALLAATGLDPGIPYGHGVLPGFVLLPAGAAAAFAGAAVLATDRVPAERTGLAGGVHNTAMETGPTVVLAVLLAAGSDAVSLAVAAGVFAVAAGALRFRAG